MHPALRSRPNTTTGPKASSIRRYDGYELDLTGDLAIVELLQPLEFSDRVRPMCLPAEFREDVGELAYAAGHGTHDCA